MEAPPSVPHPQPRPCPSRPCPSGEAGRQPPALRGDAPPAAPSRPFPGGLGFSEPHSAFPCFPSCLSALFFSGVWRGHGPLGAAAASACDTWDPCSLETPLCSSRGFRARHSCACMGPAPHSYTLVRRTELLAPGSRPPPPPPPRTAPWGVPVGCLCQTARFSWEIPVWCSQP